METSDQEFVKTVQRWEWFKSKGALLFQIIGVLYAFLVCYPQKFIGIILGLAVLLFPAVFVVVTALAALVVLGWDDPFAWSLAVFLTINTIGNVVMGAKLKRFQFDTPAAQVTHREPILKTLKRLLKSPITIQALAGVVIICIVSLLAIFVWPTRYSYDHIKEGSNTFPVRIDRLTGKTATLYREGGWVSTDPTAMTTPTPRAPEIQDIPE